MISSLIILALLFPLIIAQAPTSPSGLTLDPCIDSTECVAPRTCRKSTIPHQCSSNPTDSACLRCLPPEGLYACTTVNDCPPNESCFANPDLPALACMSSTSGSLLGAKIVGHSDRSRLTLDICSVNQDCSGERVCKFLSPVVTEPCENRTTCKCLTVTPVTCVTSDTCEPGEICVLTLGLGSICVSKVVASEAGVPSVEESANAPPGPETPALPPPNQATSPPSTDTPIVEPPEQTAVSPSITGYSPGEASGDSQSQPTLMARPGPPPSRNGTNLVLENCISDVDCLPPRKCLFFSNSTAAGNPACDSTASCVCGFKPIPACKSDEECTDGEVCSLAGGTSIETCISQAVIDAFIEDGKPLLDTQDTLEISPEASEEPDLEEGVCMDARLLSHLRRNELVFSTHRRARVLCDEFGSCATAGHMVSHFGKVFMMRRYCSIVGCSERFMMVNSPRRRTGIEVPSRTEGLVLTAFAARYATSLEETILRFAIKMKM